MDSDNAINELHNKVAQLEKTVFIGNGGPSLMTKVETAGVEIDNIKRDVAGVRKDLATMSDKIDKLNSKLSYIAAEITIGAGIVAFAASLLTKWIFKAN